MGDNSTRLINDANKVVEIREFRVLDPSMPLDCSKDTIYEKIILKPGIIKIVDDPRKYRESQDHTSQVSLLMIFCDGSYEEMKPLSAQDFIGSKTITITNKQDPPNQNSTQAVRRRFVVTKEPRKVSLSSLAVQIVSQGQTTPEDLQSAASDSGFLSQIVSQGQTTPEDLESISVATSDSGCLSEQQLQIVSHGHTTPADLQFISFAALDSGCLSQGGRITGCSAHNWMDRLPV